MKRAVKALAVLLCFAAPAVAADGPKISLGYAYLKYLETGGGDAPLGAYLSGWGTGRTTLELDLGWHRDKEAGTTLNTFTVMAGPPLPTRPAHPPDFAPPRGAPPRTVIGPSEPNH